jgi:hypothetical protein
MFFLVNQYYILTKFRICSYSDIIDDIDTVTIGHLMFQLFTEKKIYLNMTKYTIAFYEVYKNFGISFTINIHV